MVLNEEVKTRECTSRRSQTTGRLLIVMPKISADGEVIRLSNDVKFNSNSNLQCTFEYIENRTH